MTIRPTSTNNRTQYTKKGCYRLFNPPPNTQLPCWVPQMNETQFHDQKPFLKKSLFVSQLSKGPGITQSLVLPSLFILSNRTGLHYSINGESGSSLAALVFGLCYDLQFAAHIPIILQNSCVCGECVYVCVIYHWWKIKRPCSFPQTRRDWEALSMNSRLINPQLHSQTKSWMYFNKQVPVLVLENLFTKNLYAGHCTLTLDSIFNEFCHFWGQG